MAKWLVYRCINERCPAHGGRWPVEAASPEPLLRCPSCETIGRYERDSTSGSTSQLREGWVGHSTPGNDTST